MSNKSKYTTFLTLSLCCFTLFAVEEEIKETEAKQEVADAAHVFFMSRVEAIPDKKMAENNTDHYLEGYIQALVDMHYYEHQVIVLVDRNVIYLYNLPHKLAPIQFYYLVCRRSSLC